MIQQKVRRACYAELVFLHPVGSAGRVVHSGAFGVRKLDALFFILGWVWCAFHKSTPGQVMPNLSFSIQWDLRVTYCFPVRTGREMSTQ
jgi:hypothetical protein